MLPQVGEADGMRLAAKQAGYRVAGTAVALMQQRLSAGGLLRVLEDAGRSGDFASAYASAAGESLTTFTRSFPALLAAAHPGPEVAVTAAPGGVRYLLSGFAPRSAIAVSIKGTAYDLHFSVTADGDGRYEAPFGATSPPGEHVLTAAGTSGTAQAPLSVARPG